MVLYLAIVAVMSIALTDLGINIIYGGAKSGADQEIYSSGRYILQRIETEIRNSGGIATLSPTTLTLIDPYNVNNTVIALTGSTLSINKAGTGAVAINPAGIQVTNLAFVNFSSADNKSKNVQFTFTVQTDPAQVRSEYKQTLNFEASAEVRSN